MQFTLITLRRALKANPFNLSSTVAVSGQYLGGSGHGYGDGYPPLSPRSTARNQNNRPQSSPPQKVTLLALLYISIRQGSQILMMCGIMILMVWTVDPYGYPPLRK